MIEKYPHIKAAAVILQNGKALLTRSKGESVFVPPGGMPIGKETVAEACILGVEDDLGIGVVPEDLEYIGTFCGQSEINTGIAPPTIGAFIVGHYTGRIRPYEDVEEIMPVGSEVPAGIEIDPTFLHDIIPYLKKSDLID